MLIAGKSDSLWKKKLLSWVRDVAHDLKAPIGAIKGYAEIIRSPLPSQPEETATPQEYAESIISLGGRMHSMVESLSVVAQAKAEQTEHSFEVFSLAELVADALELYRIPFQQKGLWLRMPIPQNLCLIKGDPNMVDRVIQNMLQNALTHSASGGEVEIVIEKTQDWQQVHISNRAAHPFPQDYVDWFQLPVDETPKPPSSNGLGLAIVRGIMELHGGKILMESTADNTLNFSILFPPIST